MTADVIANALFGILLFVVILTGQVIVFMVIYYNRHLLDGNNIYIVSLSVADTLLCLFSVPIYTAYVCLQEWPFSRLACDIWQGMDVALSVISINIICFIAVDRFLCLKFPFTYPIQRTKNVALLVQIIIWSLSFLGQFIYIYATQVYYVEGTDGRQCVLNYTVNVSLTLVYVSFTLYFPILLTLVMYISIYRIAREMNQVSNAMDLSAVDSSSHLTQKENVKALKTIGLLLMAYVICWGPIGAAVITESIHPGRISPWFLVIAYWLGYANSALNPICYSIGNPQFRETLKERILAKMTLR